MKQAKLIAPGLPIVFALLGTVAHADEVAEKMVQDALPVMYHTCASAIAAADGNDAYVLDVVRKITAVSLYNRNIDINEYATTDAEKAQLREKFLANLKAACDSDRDALLAGAIDDAVKETLGL